jgi:glutaconate CoA-transferase subunit B
LRDYTLQELMVVAAAREIGDGEVVFVGMRLPLLAFALAKRTHAPAATGLYENGVVRDAPPAELLYTMADNPNIAGAVSCSGMEQVMALLQQGAVHTGFIGGAEVDRFGNLNTSYIGDPERPLVKLPGSGGAADIATLSHRFLIIMPHERKRFVPRVGYITSPGYGDGAGWRQRQGLVRGGPSCLISSMGVFRFDPTTCEAYLDTFHPGYGVDELRENTGWDLKVSPAVAETKPPTPAELAIVRESDPVGFWTGRKPPR